LHAKCLDTLWDDIVTWPGCGKAPVFINNDAIDMTATRGFDGIMVD
jgi:hypothetical protein